MAVTATGSIAVTTGILTVGAPSGGSFVPGDTINGTGISAVASPAVVLGTQLTGTTGQAGTYNTNITTAVASTTLTFTLVNHPVGLKFPPSTNANAAAAPNPYFGTVIPPGPLPGITGGGGGGSGQSGYTF